MCVDGRGRNTCQFPDLSKAKPPCVLRFAYVNGAVFAPDTMMSTIHTCIYKQYVISEGNRSLKGKKVDSRRSG